MKKYEDIFVSTPKPFQEIGSNFVISGLVPVSWLKDEFGTFDNRLFLDLIDIDGIAFSCDTIFLPRINWLWRLLRKVPFDANVQFNQFNLGFLEKSQGRVTIKISAKMEDDKSVYIPLIIKELEPENGVDLEVLEKHKTVGSRIKQYKQDLKDYYRQLEEIRKRREVKDNIFDDAESNKFSYSGDLNFAHEILNILNQSEENFEEYLYSEEDKEEQKLEEKYKDAIAWRGPLFRGLVAKFGPFEMRVYSNDHDKHFHVIHKSKGVNARFSFPQIELMNYKKSRNTIGSKELKKICEFCKRPEIFERLEKEFSKRQ